MITIHRTALSTLFMLLATACASSPPSDADTSESGSVTIALASVPTAIQCIQITATGASTISKPFSVTAGASTASLAFGQLPLGAVTFTGSAYNVACASIAGATAQWLADAQTVTVQTGIIPSVNLTFRPNNASSVTANFVGNVTDVAVGPNTTYFMYADGSVKAAGNAMFQGWPTTPVTVAMPVPQLAGAIHIAPAPVSTGWADALLSNGTVVQWGNGSTAGDTRGLPNGVQITAGTVTGCELTATGAVACWGICSDQECGSAFSSQTFASSTNFFETPIASGALSVQAGAWTTCAILGNGAVECWGASLSTAGAIQPTPQTFIGDATKQLAVGGAHACAVSYAGALRCWGNDASGQIGNGSMNATYVATPYLLSSLGVVQQVAASASATCALTKSGSVYCWGDSAHGEVPDGNGTSNAFPVVIPALAGATKLVSSPTANAFCAMMGDQSVRCWGQNDGGQLGNGTVADAFVPTPVLMQ
jgi:alpha-tubulin suppressor-like RCC1 family protein